MNEGGRCQIDSDCASGLKCSSYTGNGMCISTTITINDAARNLVEQEAGPLTSEVGDEAVASPEIDADISGTGAVDSGSLDSTALDLVSLDSTGLD